MKFIVTIERDKDGMFVVPLLSGYEKILVCCIF